MGHKENGEPNLSKYYPIAGDMEVGELPEFTLKNISIGFMVLGLIAFMMNALMVYLYMKQRWVIIWPSTWGAQLGAILMVVGTVLYLGDKYLAGKF